MDKKLKGDIAEQKVILEALKQNIGVSRPIGDRLAYDMIFDVGGELHRVQVKSAYRTDKGFSCSGAKRTLTNRKITKTRFYKETDFDYAILVADDDYYIVPSKEFVKQKSSTVILTLKKEELAIVQWSKFKNAWSILRASQEEILEEKFVKFGEGPSKLIPSQVLEIEKV